MKPRLDDAHTWRHGWLPAVAPAGARRFRVRNPDLAASLARAGAELVETAPDVEIGAPDVLHGDAECALVPINAPVSSSTHLPLRAAGRVARSSYLLGRAALVRRVLRRHGYAETAVLTWERTEPLGLATARGFSRRPLAHRFPLNVVVVGNREPPRRTALEEAVAEAERGSRIPLSGAMPVLASSGVIISINNRAVLRVGFGTGAREIEGQLRALESLRAGSPSEFVSERVPWILAHGRSGLVLWAVELRLPGSTPSSPLPGDLLRECVDFLVALYAAGRLSTPVGAPTKHAEAIAAACGPRSAEALVECGRNIDRTLAGLPRGFGHWDFWSGNLLVERSRLLGVVDWSSAGPGRLPLLDLLHLQAMLARKPSDQHLGPLIVRHLLPSVRIGGDELVHSYCRRLGLELAPAELQALVAAYWLERAEYELQIADVADGPTWIRHNVEPVLSALRAVRGS